jgi:hypothetical protein
MYNKIYYIYHSHTNENCDFSETDKVCSENLNLPIILYNIKKNIFKIHNPIKIQDDFIGRYYQYGKHDCFTLIQEFYKKEKSIELKYNEEFYLKSLQQIDIKSEIYKFIINNDFKVIDDKESLELHDILLIDIFGENEIKHFALYMGQNKILHQPINTFSKIENYCNFYKRRTKLAFRVKI